MANDYVVPVYLNQRVVFDLLAILEDGLAQMSTIKTSDTSKKEVEANIGASNVFALLGVGLKGGRDQQSGREVTQERVHTPTSLFAKVRSRLRAAKLVHDLTPETEHTPVTSGQFVEFEVRLRRNPLVEALEAVVETIGAIKVLTSWSQDGKRSAADKAQGEQLKLVAEQAKRLLGALGSGAAIDLIGPILPGPGTALLTAEMRYFGESLPTELTDGMFRVFGKVVRSAAGTEKVSLLRNTQFAHMPNVLDALREAVQSANSSGLALPEVVTELEAPVLQVIPIAIFV